MGGGGGGREINTQLIVFMKACYLQYYDRLITKLIRKFSCISPCE